MDIYDSLLDAVRSEYDTITLIKKSERGEVSLVRHRDSGTRYIFRHFYGSSEVYRKLLSVSCPNLPKIMEVGEKDGRTVLLEEHVQGDTLSEILPGRTCVNCAGKKDVSSVVFSIMGASFYGGGAPGCKTG